MTPAVFLDRDGVLNRAIVRDGRPYPPANLSELVIFEDSARSLERLREAGYLLIVVSNQPDIARGRTSAEAVEEIHVALRSCLPIEEIYICPHDDADNCSCRKPQPGLLLRAAERYNIDLSESFLIGDRWRDIDAGAAAGCRTVLIDRRYGERAPSRPPNTSVLSLTKATDWILSHRMIEDGTRR